jgi:transposase
MDNYHHHARTTKHGREHMAKSVLEGRLSLRKAAAECRFSRQSAAKWIRRYREAGVAGLLDRSSRPHRSPRDKTALFHHGFLARARERYFPSSSGIRQNFHHLSTVHPMS